MIFRNLGTWISSLRADPIGTLIEIVFMVAALLLSLMLHEIGHGYAALKCGDPTAKMLGRLTLDPRKHLDPIGAICNPRNFRNRNRDMIIVSFAGIFVNLVLFTVSCFLYVLSFKAGGTVMAYAREFLVILLSFNISLAIFNLVPVPPMDGYRLVNQIFFRGELDRQMTPQTMQIIHMIFLFICLSGVLSTTFSRVCSFCMNGMVNLFYQLLF